jgi:hypothetical protein
MDRVLIFWLLYVEWVNENQDCSGYDVWTPDREITKPPRQQVAKTLVLPLRVRRNENGTGVLAGKRKYEKLRMLRERDGKVQGAPARRSVDQPGPCGIQTQGKEERLGVFIDKTTVCLVDSWPVLLLRHPRNEHPHISARDRRLGVQRT